jgi:hypothetical protein
MIEGVVGEGREGTAGLEPLHRIIRPDCGDPRSIAGGHLCPESCCDRLDMVANVTVEKVEQAGSIEPRDADRVVAFRAAVAG